LGEAAAARLAAAFLADSAARVARLAEGLGGTVLALHAPDDAGVEVAPLLPPGFAALLPQGSGDLGARMERGLAALLARGSPALLTGTDLPTMPSALLREAIGAVADGGADVALVPVLDGGYGAIALARHAPRLFRGIAWSTAGVMAATERAALASGLHLHATAPWYDVDSLEDLARLRAELGGTPPAGCAPLPGEPAPATRRALAQD